MIIEKMLNRLHKVSGQTLATIVIVFVLSWIAGYVIVALTFFHTWQDGPPPADSEAFNMNAVAGPAYEAAKNATVLASRKFFNGDTEQSH